MGNERLQFLFTEKKLMIFTPERYSKRQKKQQ